VPELLEVELYRRAALPAVGRTVESVSAPDRSYVRASGGAAAVVDAVEGRTIHGMRRHGKVLVVEFDSGRSLGLRFGMTGRLVVDGVAPIGELWYGSGRDLPVWDRFVMGFLDGGQLRLNDPRRLGGVELDPDLDLLGPDVWTLTPSALRGALTGGETALKARLLDQRRVAGLGNLLVDEVLWRAGLDPARPAGSLSTVELQRLHRTIRTALPELLARGGSHTGALQGERHREGRCPRDGARLLRRTVGGRTTLSCPQHQH
jgi:formamidopyrimidine-DNA glycosylase